MQLLIHIHNLQTFRQKILISTLSRIPYLYTGQHDIGIVTLYPVQVYLRSLNITSRR